MTIERKTLADATRARALCGERVLAGEVYSLTIFSSNEPGPSIREIVKKGSLFPRSPSIFLRFLHRILRCKNAIGMAES
jgi:hypothetical protein